MMRERGGDIRPENRHWLIVLVSLFPAGLSQLLFLRASKGLTLDPAIYLSHHRWRDIAAGQRIFRGSIWIRIICHHYWDGPALALPATKAAGTLRNTEGSANAILRAKAHADLNLALLTRQLI